ncbi:BA75_02618T0 [Komagataella pastoris]|uniref:glucan endo-1,3-beta-D-glucosidase n=1 Tax=Komagataella pastoris TaxID=4922 RepID=A0A1B2JAP9_PICPA|nr:BA75_02618T0 [Komagataella pastoris]
MYPRSPTKGKDRVEKKTRFEDSCSPNGSSLTQLDEEEEPSKYINHEIKLEEHLNYPQSNDSVKSCPIIRSKSLPLGNWRSSTESRVSIPITRSKSDARVGESEHDDNMKTETVIFDNEFKWKYPRVKLDSSVVQPLTVSSFEDANSEPVTGPISSIANSNKSETLDMKAAQVKAESNDNFNEPTDMDYETLAFLKHPTGRVPEVGVGPSKNFMTSPIAETDNKNKDIPVKFDQPTDSSKETVGLKLLDTSTSDVMFGSSVHSAYRKPEANEYSDEVGNETASFAPSSVYSEKAGKYREYGSWKSPFYVGCILVLLGSLIASLSILVPLVGELVDGTTTTVFNYMNRVSPTERQKLVEQLISHYNLSATNTSSSVSPKIMIQIPPASNLSQDGVQNSYAGLNKKFHSNMELESLMSEKMLQKSIYGVNYAPRGSLQPMCGVDYNQVVLDLGALSMVTSRLKLYGLQCQQAAYVLDVIQDMGLNMTVSLGVWLNNDNQSNENQISELQKILLKVRRNQIDTIFVGNEVLWRHELSSDSLFQYIKQVKRIVQQLGWYDLPVGTNEHYSCVKEEWVDKLDILGINLHPFFNGTTAESAPGWVNSTLYSICSTKSCMEKIAIGETGWPYQGGRFINAIAEKKNYDSYLKGFSALARHLNIPWFWFEAFDEPWKRIYENGENKWETEWGLFTVDRKLKEGIELPKF